MAIEEYREQILGDIFLPDPYTYDDWREYEVAKNNAITEYLRRIKTIIQGLTKIIYKDTAPTGYIHQGTIWVQEAHNQAWIWIGDKWTPLAGSRPF